MCIIELWCINRCCYCFKLVTMKVNILPLTIWNSCLSMIPSWFFNPTNFIMLKGFARMFTCCFAMGMYISLNFLLCLFLHMKWLQLYIFSPSLQDFIFMALFTNFKPLWISQSYNNVNPWFSIFNSCNNLLIHLFYSAKMIPNHYFDVLKGQITSYWRLWSRFEFFFLRTTLKCIHGWGITTITMTPFCHVS
jgi:hypothetical protein